MYLLLSGEGPSDIGRCKLGHNQCEGELFEPGAMTIFIDQLVEQIVEQQQGYELSHLDCERVGFLSETHLAKNKVPTKSAKSMSLTGKKRKKETGYFYQNARALATIARTKSIEINDSVIAILFRDADGTASAGRGLYQNKLNSMHQGFADEQYGELGVPMIPKPKSEAWILCALKENPYHHCNSLENSSGNDNSPNALKNQLKARQSQLDLNNSLVELVKERKININQIDMDSFNQFKDDLKKAVIAALG